MKFKNKAIHYIPNLVNKKFGGIDEYRVMELDKFGMLSMIMEQVSFSIEDLLSQYPNCFEEEVIQQLLDYQFDYAKNCGIDVDCCYQYFGKKDKITQGIIIKQPIYSDVVPIKITKTEFINGQVNYQRRIDAIYEVDDEFIIPTSVVEVGMNNGVVVQSSYHPNVLKKARRYVRY